MLIAPCDVVELQDCTEYLNTLFRRLLVTGPLMGLSHVNVLRRRLKEKRVKY